MFLSLCLNVYNVLICVFPRKTFICQQRVMCLIHNSYKRSADKERYKLQSNLEHWKVDKNRDIFFLSTEVDWVSVHFCRWRCNFVFISHFPVAVRFGGVSPSLPFKYITKPSVGMKISCVCKASLIDPYVYLQLSQRSWNFTWRRIKLKLFELSYQNLTSISTNQNEILRLNGFCLL